MRSKDPAQALSELKLAAEKALDQKLKNRAAQEYWSLLLELGRLEEAFSFLGKFFPNEANFYKLLALKALEENEFGLATKVIAALEEKFPEDSETAWLKGLLLEKKGEGEKALSVWQKVAQKEDVFGKLGQSIVKAAKLIEESREEVY